MKENLKKHSWQTEVLVSNETSSTERTKSQGSRSSGMSSLHEERKATETKTNARKQSRIAG
ncbi:MAG: hypothetical protein HWD62_02535 [Cyclobacteriaceae bacterium]|nr:MAG: hypothetical protein HWD62_02535 [Cyclobacteriaceae bacterium]